jgi:hypothetical protein
MPFRKAGLEGRIRAWGFLPHDRIVEMLRRADALWMTVGRNEGPTVSTSKIYEYLGARKPILASVPSDGPAAALIRETGSGQVLDPEDHVSLSRAIAGLCRLRRSGQRAYHGDPAALARYDRREIARRLAGMLDEMVGRSE